VGGDRALNSGCNARKRAGRTKTVKRVDWKTGLLVCLLVAAGGAHAAESLLVPGADLSQLVLKKGAWCRYAVVDEALGQKDSTEVYVGVPAAESTPQGPAFWLELASRPLGAGDEEGQILKLLVLEAVTRFSEGDSLGDYVVKFYIKKGTRAVEEADPKTYEDFSLIVPTSESSWETIEEVPTTTRAGEFSCVKKTRVVEENKEIPTGRVKLIKKSRDDYTVWFDNSVPLFRLVKCVIERSRETVMVPRVAGIPVSGTQYSKTTAELTGFGSDAKPVLSVESRSR
jgi:hypothetical protein